MGRHVLAVLCAFCSGGATFPLLSADPSAEEYLCRPYAKLLAPTSNLYASTTIRLMRLPSQKSRPRGWLVPQRKSMAKKPTISSAQVRAARALLNWSARRLSEISGVSQSAISRVERGKGRRAMHPQSFAAVKSTFERYGVEFLDDSGVRLRSQAAEPDAGENVQSKSSPANPSPQSAVPRRCEMMTSDVSAGSELARA
jgi:transcriptional regulator with XRE-family HTH domain